MMAVKFLVVYHDGCHRPCTVIWSYKLLVFYSCHRCYGPFNSLDAIAHLLQFMEFLFLISDEKWRFQ